MIRWKMMDNKKNGARTGDLCIARLLYLMYTDGH